MSFEQLYAILILFIRLCVESSRYFFDGARHFLSSIFVQVSIDDRFG
jgi:hypothetical protein